MISKVRFTEILIYYDGPQLAFCQDQNGNDFLSQAVDLERSEDNFLCIRIDEEMKAELLDGRIDVRHAFFKPVNKKWYTFSYGGSDQFRLNLAFRKVWEIPPDFLPDHGLYLDKILKKSHIPAQPSSTIIYDYKIDGSWEVRDLSNFNNLYNEVYSFLHITNNHSQRLGLGNSISGTKAFGRYPWRGGFSSVYFYDEIYYQIPKAERPWIKSMQYASPGTISIQANRQIVEAINHSLSTIIHNKYTYDKVYYEIYKSLKEKNFLGKDVKFGSDGILPEDKTYLNECKRELENVMGLRISGMLDELTTGPLATVKILLSLWRRFDRIREFVFLDKLKID